MAEHVQITVRSTSRFGGQEDQLIFRGTGALEKLPGVQRAAVNYTAGGICGMRRPTRPTAAPSSPM